jgi:hypothetical protein
LLSMETEVVDTWRHTCGESTLRDFSCPSW